MRSLDNCLDIVFEGLKFLLVDINDYRSVITILFQCIILFYHCDYICFVLY